LNNKLANLTSKVSVLIAALASLLMFSWPLFFAGTVTKEADLAQAVFILLMPIVLILILVEVATGDIGSKQLALLGVLIALNAVIRLLGAGTAGIETAFFLIIIAAYVFGSGFGFLLGSGSLLVSALITGGVGPWLPFQMMAAGLIGIGAGILPKVSPKWGKLTILIGYAIPASFLYGALMTLWNWPFVAGSGSSISYLAGAGVVENLLRFLQFQIFTGGLIWDAGRALTTSLLIAITAPLLLSTLQRAAAKAGFVKLSKSANANQTAALPLAKRS
jgi:energy-coupling factor transport system substrate-specific component